MGNPTVKHISWLFIFLLAPHCLDAQQHWWEQEPLRILDLGTSFGQITYEPAAKLAAEKAAQFYNAEHLDIMNMPAGLDDQGFFFRSKVAGRQNEDFLGAYVPEAHRRGIRVMIYFNVHWYHKKFGEQHPDWRQVREDGRPIDDVYSTGTSFCINGPWREWVFQVLRDLCAYPIDGIFYDGPIFFPDTCYCRYCREKYRKLYGGEMPSKKVHRGEAFQKLLEFQVRSMNDFLRDSRQVIKSINPEIAFYMNGGVRGGNWATARLNRRLIGEQDILGSEGGFLGGDLTRIPVWKPGVTARLLETQAGGKPRVIFSASSQKPWAFSVLPSAELRLLYAGTIANAASVWFGMSPSEFVLPEMRAIAEMNRFLAEHKQYYEGTRSEATAAVVWSDTTANFYQGSDAILMDAQHVAAQSRVGDLEAAFSGITDAIWRAQTPFDVLDDTSLEQENLGRYKAIFLPNVACMSTRSAERLREYVRNGGSLFATFETSLYDETGTRRQDFSLADVLGAHATREMAGPMRWDYMRPQSHGGLLQGLEHELLPATIYHVRVRPDGSDTLIQFAQPLGGRYDGIPAASSDPALLAHRYGKGEVIYAPGDLGATISEFHLAEHLGIVRNALARQAPSAVRIEGAPSSLEVVLRSQQNGSRLLLHLINSTGEMTRPIQRVVPLENLHISLRTTRPVKRIHTLMAPGELKAQAAPGEVRFVVPRLQEYEVVVIER